MKTVIAGSRNFENREELEKAIRLSGFDITQVITGGCSDYNGCLRGVDKIAVEWAICNAIPCYIFPANWKTLGKRAGPMRNIVMAASAEAAILVYNRGISRGTLSMEEQARKKGLKVYSHHAPQISKY